METEKLKKALEQLYDNHSNTKAGLDTVLAVVLKVNEEDATCNCKSAEEDEDVYYGVRLNTDIGAKTGIIPIPKVGSFVILQRIDKENAYLAFTSELENYKISAEAILLNDGENGGLVKVQPLVDKINRLENTLNQLIGLYNLHVHPGDGTPTASTLSENITPPTQIADLENDKIKH